MTRAEKIRRIKWAVFAIIGHDCLACSRLGRLRAADQVNHVNGRHWSIRRVNQETRWRRYLREAILGRVEPMCSDCNRRHGARIRYRKVDKTRQGGRR